MNSKNKLNLFQTNKQFFIWMCVHPAIKNDKRIPYYILCTCLGLLSLLIGICGTTAFFIKNLQTDTGSSLEALYQLAGIKIGFCIAIIGLIKRKQIQEIIKQFEDFCNTCKCELHVGTLSWTYV